VAFWSIADEASPLTTDQAEMCDLQSELEIRRMIERWAVWRDAGDSERFATEWHRGEVMIATWLQAPNRSCA
jgi:hypothetical protein